MSPATLRSHLLFRGQQQQSARDRGRTDRLSEAVGRQTTPGAVGVTHSSNGAAVSGSRANLVELDGREHSSLHLHGRMALPDACLGASLYFHLNHVL